MEYEVIVKKLNPHIEEEVTIKVNSFELVCFDPNGAIHWEVNKRYKAKIGFSVFNDLAMRETKELFGFSQIDNTLGYYIRGKFDLDSRTMDAGIRIQFNEDEFDLHDYSYWDGKNVEIRVDRINIELIK